MWFLCFHWDGLDDGQMQAALLVPKVKGHTWTMLIQLKWDSREILICEGIANATTTLHAVSDKFLSLNHADLQRI